MAVEVPAPRDSDNPEPDLGERVAHDGLTAAATARESVRKITAPRPATTWPADQTSIASRHAADADDDRAADARQCTGSRWPLVTEQVTDQIAPSADKLPTTIALPLHNVKSSSATY